METFYNNIYFRRRVSFFIYTIKSLNDSCVILCPNRFGQKNDKMYTYLPFRINYRSTDSGDFTRFVDLCKYIEYHWERADRLTVNRNVTVLCGHANNVRRYVLPRPPDDGFPLAIRMARTRVKFFFLFFFFLRFSGRNRISGIRGRPRE